MQLIAKDFREVPYGRGFCGNEGGGCVQLLALSIRKQDKALDLASGTCLLLNFLLSLISTILNI